ncbi:NAD(P)/FAD-dependent oxidoreductase [Paenibacillus frigoriresistens]|uniref:NAD(P)/FAD-dependent oxidoreductase n=1 Tax=Paenibacillus alginolyticus TaxID=59839 RepID=UPI001566A85D|nr:NAD(P)/FAD-dependent oxidoreductase [Paenibacillus frigoriresistens]NRF92464.1 NAD(P)/FAD-dependent oxidoreductase [Paenibacillus frigoriresistens]
MNHIQDVAVLGAGIAGSSLAKSLADRGWETVLIDRKQFPRHKVCGEFLSPESQSMLNSLGLHELVESLQPSLIHRSRLIFSNGDALEIPFPGIALGVSRYSLDAALHSSALSSGVLVHTATTVTSVRPDKEGYTIEAKQGAERKIFRVRAVVSALGANCHSVLPGRRPNNTIKNSFIGVKSHFRGLAMEPVVELYFFDGGYLGISPIEGGIFNVAALLKWNAFQNTEKTILGLIDAACRRNPKLYQKLANAVPVPGTQAAVAPVDLNRKLLAWDLIPLVGDAAVMIPPLCGDGMSMALRSASLCAPLADSFLRGQISLREWQHEYSQSIEREFKSPLRWGRLLQWLLGVPILPRLLLSAAQVTPGLAYGLLQATRLKEGDS